MGNELVALSIGTRTFALVSGQVYNAVRLSRHQGGAFIVELGVVFPQTELGADPGAIRAFVQGIETFGYDSVFVADHVLGATHLVVESRQNGLTFPDEHLEVLRHFKDVAGAILS